jgi:hypothetical protein
MNIAMHEKISIKIDINDPSAWVARGRKSGEARRASHSSSSRRRDSACLSKAEIRDTRSPPPLLGRGLGGGVRDYYLFIIFQNPFREENAVTLEPAVY